MNATILPMPLHGPRFDAAMEVYGAAFALPPYNDPGRGREVRQRILDVHADRPGFRGFVATDSSDRVVGMVYGYHGEPGQWWHDTVVQQLERDAASRWLGDSYELVEVAVDPAWQARGIGRGLIDALLAGRDEATCVLSTRTDSRAHRLYERLGFERVHTMRFSPGGAPFFVMGCRLPLAATAADATSGQQPALS